MGEVDGWLSKEEEVEHVAIGVSRLCSQEDISYYSKY